MNTALSIRQRQLRLSIQGFGLLAALLSTGFYLLFLSQAASSLDLLVGATAALVLTSMFWWWRLVVTPDHITWLRGAVAGLISLISALPIMWLVIAIFDALSGSATGASNPLDMLLASVFLGVLSALSLFVSLPGWLLLLLAGSAGAGHAELVRRFASPVVPRKPEGANLQAESALQWGAIIHDSTTGASDVSRETGWLLKDQEDVL